MKNIDFAIQQVSEKFVANLRVFGESSTLSNKR